MADLIGKRAAQQFNFADRPPWQRCFHSHLSGTGRCRRDLKVKKAHDIGDWRQDRRIGRMDGPARKVRYPDRRGTVHLAGWAG
jgi:hypothetical protein